MKHAALMLASVITTTANAKILPDAVDLKAAYCIPIVRSAAEITGGDALPEPGRTEVRVFREKAQQDLRRLQLYLLPRLELLDSDPLFGASQAATDDQARARAELQSCMAKPGAELKACLAVESEAQKRIGSCRDLSFLPF